MKDAYNITIVLYQMLHNWVLNRQYNILYDMLYALQTTLYNSTYNMLVQFPWLLAQLSSMKGNQAGGIVAPRQWPEVSDFVARFWITRDSRMAVGFFTCATCKNVRHKSYTMWDPNHIPRIIPRATAYWLQIIRWQQATLPCCKDTPCQRMVSTVMI